MFGRKIRANDHTEIEILEPGLHNNDAGPDFLNARLRYNGEIWSGNVEIHVKASDWYRHKHDSDPKYENVILHVVGVDDKEIKRTNGTTILQVCVSPPREFYERYAQLAREIDEPRCIPFMQQIPELNKTDWMESLGVERLIGKATYMKSILASTNGDWQQTLFILMARALGFGLNGVPFEMLAKSLPLNYVMRHRDHPEQIEALLFGQAAMLDPSVFPNDKYYRILCREYGFLSKKYQLRPIAAGMWKYSRTRPLNFPHRRLAILSAMLASGIQIRDRLIDAKGDIEKLMEILNFNASQYWKENFNFGNPSDHPLPTTLSNSAKEVIIINVAAPFYYAYGSIIGDPEQGEHGVNLLYELKPEKNSVTIRWGNASLKAKSAFESQAQIQLMREYCEKERCLDCRFGHYLLRKTMA